MTGRDIVKEYLRAHGYDGLFARGECACLVDDLMPCGETLRDCSPGYHKPCDCGDHVFHITADKPEGKP